MSPRVVTNGELLRGDALLLGREQAREERILLERLEDRTQDLGRRSAGLRGALGAIGRTGGADLLQIGERHVERPIHASVPDADGVRLEVGGHGEVALAVHSGLLVANSGSDEARELTKRAELGCHDGSLLTAGVMRKDDKSKRGAWNEAPLAKYFDKVKRS